MIYAGCSSNTKGGSCNDNTNCYAWQYCNATGHNCATLPGYCTADSECNDSLLSCDLAKTHKCIFSEGRCRTNANCDIWQVCDSTNYCRAAPGYCDSDSVCEPTYEFCNPATNKCSPAPGYCTSDTDCDAWKKCDVVSKRCYLIAGRCDLDGDCENWQNCDVKAHRCVAKSGYCVNDDNCDTSWSKCDMTLKKCVARQGFCAGDNECNDWEFCSGGSHRCTPLKDRCSTFADCGSWQFCDTDHYCKHQTGYCDEDKNCVTGEVCNQNNHLCQ